MEASTLCASVGILPLLKTPSDPVDEAVKRVWQELQAESKMNEIHVISAKEIEQAVLAKEEAVAGRDQLAVDSQVLRSLLKEELLKMRR